MVKLLVAGEKWLVGGKCRDSVPRSACLLLLPLLAALRWIWRMANRIAAVIRLPFHNSVTATIFMMPRTRVLNSL